MYEAMEDLDPDYPPAPSWANLEPSVTTLYDAVARKVLLHTFDLLLCLKATDDDVIARA